MSVWYENTSKKVQTNSLDLIKNRTSRQVAALFLSLPGPHWTPPPTPPPPSHTDLGSNVDLQRLFWKHFKDIFHTLHLRDQIISNLQVQVKLCTTAERRADSRSPPRLTPPPPSLMWLEWRKEQPVVWRQEVTALTEALTLTYCCSALHKWPLTPGSRSSAL